MKKDSKITFEEKLIIRKNKAKTVFIAKLSCIALVFCMVALYFFAPVSQVSNFKLEGNIYFTPSDILEIAHLNKKTSLYSINTKEVEELLTSHPLIEKSKVKCDFFGLKIKIEEIAPLCNYDGKIYLSNGEVVTEEMKNNELYGSFLVSNLDKTYRADFNPTEIRNKQLEHFNAIWIHASENAKQKTFHISYNQNMLDMAPTTSIIGCRINWEPYMVSAVGAVLNDEKIEKVLDADIHGTDAGAGFLLCSIILASHTCEIERDTLEGCPLVPSRHISELERVQ